MSAPPNTEAVPKLTILATCLLFRYTPGIKRNHHCGTQSPSACSRRVCVLDGSWRSRCRRRRRGWLLRLGRRLPARDAASRSADDTAERNHCSGHDERNGVRLGGFQQRPCRTAR